MTLNPLSAALRNLLVLPGVTQPFAPLMRGRACIFMFHRFRDDERGIVGQDPAAVRRLLEFLRRERYDILPLDELIGRLAEQSTASSPADDRSPDRAVAFTLDDGTIDQATIAAPLFAAYDCPATTFLATGYVDGRIWLWWDLIEHIFMTTARRKVRVSFGDASWRTYAWTDAAGRARAQVDFTDQCKRVPEAIKNETIVALAEAADVEIPRVPTGRYAPMSWSDARALEARGMSFGSHTDTHPILAQTDDVQSSREINHSWARLCAEISRPVPVFCYPNGLRDDFGSRETRTLAEIGMVGAVVAGPRYAVADEIRSTPEGRYLVPRIDFSDNLSYVVQSVSGLRRVKETVRAAFSMSPVDRNE